MRRKSRIGDGVKVSRRLALPGLVLADQRDALVDDELVVLEGAVGLDPLTKLAALDLEAVWKQVDDVHRGVVVGVRAREIWSDEIHEGVGLRREFDRRAPVRKPNSQLELERGLVVRLV